MDGCDFSSSSCFTEGEEPDETEKMSIVNVQAVMLENERLQELNSQLQAALDSTKLQLKQALEASSSVTTMNDQIQGLRQKLSQANIEKDKALSELSIYKQNADIQYSSNNDNSLLSANSAQIEINDFQKKLRKYKDEIKKLLKENESQKQAIETLQNNQAKLQKRKTKLSDNLKNIVNQLKQSEEKINELALANQKLETAQKTLIQENDSIKVQLNAAHSFNNEAETAYKSLNDDLSKQNKAYKLISDKIESQKNEINHLNIERQKMIDLICSLHSCVLSSEAMNDDLLNQKELLERKIKAAKFNSDEERLTLSEADIPFEGDLRTKCVKIFLIEQYTPSHRIQLILNEASQFIQQLNDHLAATMKETEDFKTQFNIERNGAEKYREMMRSLLKELKSVALINEKINNIAFCDSDPQFIDLMTERIGAIDPLVSDTDLNASNHQYIPLSFFSTDDQSQKKQVILRELQPSDEAFSLFSAQFLLNSLLKQKLKKLIDASIKKEELENILRVFNGSNLSDLPKIFESMREQLSKFQSSRKRSHSSYKKLQQTLLAKNKTENEMKIKIEQLQVQNDTLTNECNLLKVRLQVAANELLLKPNTSNDQMNHSLTTSIVEGDSALLKNELLKKRDEIKKLKEMIQNMQNDMSSFQKQHSKSAKRTEEELMQQITQLQQALQEANELNEKLKKKLKKIKKDYLQRFEENTIEYQKKYDETKQTFDDATISMKEKQKQTQDLTQKLIQSLSECEDFNQKYQSENNDLHMENRALQLKIAALQEDVSKERQLLKGQLSAVQLACDAKIQDVLRNMKQTIQTEKDRLFSIIVNSLSGVYKIDCSQFDEDSFVRLVAQLKKDIEKLRYFQNSAQFSQ